MTGEAPTSVIRQIVEKFKKKGRDAVRAAQEHANTPGAGVPVSPRR